MPWLLPRRDGLCTPTALGTGATFIWNSFVYTSKWGVPCPKKVSLWNRVFESVRPGAVCLGKCVNTLNAKFLSPNVDCKHTSYKYHDKKGPALKNIRIQNKSYFAMLKEGFDNITYRVFSFPSLLSWFVKNSSWRSLYWIPTTSDPIGTQIGLELKNVKIYELNYSALCNWRSKLHS